MQAWADVLGKKGDNHCGWASYNFLDCALEQSCADAVDFSKLLLNPASASACAVEFREMSARCAQAPATAGLLCPSGRARDDSDFLECE